MSDYKRDHPRVKKSLPAELLLSDEKSLFASTFDVSKTGIQIICDAITAKEIFGPGGQPVPTRPPAVRVTLRLRHPKTGASQIEADCKAVFSRRVSEREFRVGLQIDSISADFREILDAFVDDCLDPG